MIYHTAKKRTSENGFHEKRTQTSLRTTSPITYYGRTQKFIFFEFQALMGWSDNTNEVFRWRLDQNQIFNQHISPEVILQINGDNVVANIPLTNIRS